MPGLADGFAAVLGRIVSCTTTPLPCRVSSNRCSNWPTAGGSRTRAWGLVIHDWSLLSYPTHKRKVDQAKVNNGRGYELTTLLLVEGRAGQPIAPLEVRLLAAKAVYSTHPGAWPPGLPHR